MRDFELGFALTLTQSCSDFAPMPSTPSRYIMPREHLPSPLWYILRSKDSFKGAGSRTTQPNDPPSPQPVVGLLQEKAVELLSA